MIPSTPDITKVEFKNGSFSPTIHWERFDDLVKPSIRFRGAHYNEDWVRIMSLFLLLLKQ